MFIPTDQKKRQKFTKSPKINMAEQELQSNTLTTTVSRSVAFCNGSGIDEAGQVREVASGLNDELVVHHALGETQDFEAPIRSIYSGDLETDGTVTCDTPATRSQLSSAANSMTMSNVNNAALGDNVDLEDRTIIASQGGNTMTSVSISTSTSGDPSCDGSTSAGTETILSNGLGLENGSTDSLYNGTSGVLPVEETNGSFTVDVSSLAEGQIITIPGMMPDSVVISQATQEQLERPIVENSNEDSDLLSSHNHESLIQVASAFQEQVENSADQQVSDPGQIMHTQSFPQHQTLRVTAPPGITMSQEVLQNVIQQVQAQQLAEQQEQQVTLASSKDGSNAQKSGVRFTLVSPGQASVSSNAPPLGSSQNPIHIIQQGNRYTPVQQLSSDQLHQIMQVVQQQHVSKSAPADSTDSTDTGTVIFNPHTNTRIMYRVIYPSELHKAQNLPAHTTYQVVRPATLSQEQQTGIPHQKRHYRKRKDGAIVVAPGVEGEVDKEKGIPESDLSKEEKEERKKHRPRTRSGRVSKPPKHMVQDYKHIHVLDWDEDYDDSDGGYSDFKHSDEEGKVKGDAEDIQSSSPEFYLGLGAGKPKNHKCRVCDKSYIGQAGLARHFRLNPDHYINSVSREDDASLGPLQNVGLDGEDSKESSSLLSDPSLEGPPIVCSGPRLEPPHNFSEDSNTQDSLNSTGGPGSPTLAGKRRGRARGGMGFRGRGAHLRLNAHIRRKSKLKELMKKCSDEELMEVVLPRLVSVLSMWELLLIKSEKGRSRPQVDAIYQEFESLHQHVKQVCSDYLTPLTDEDLADSSLQCKMIKISNEAVASCLNLTTKMYRVEEMPEEDLNTFSSLHNQLAAAAAATAQSLTPPLPVEANDLPGIASSSTSLPSINGLDSAITSTPMLNGGSDEPSLLGATKRHQDFIQPELIEGHPAAKRPRLNSPVVGSEVTAASSSLLLSKQQPLLCQSLPLSSASCSSTLMKVVQAVGASSALSTSSSLLPQPGRASLAPTMGKPPAGMHYIVKNNGSPRDHQKLPVLLGSPQNQVLKTSISSGTPVLPYILGMSASANGDAASKALPQKVLIGNPLATGKPASLQSQPLPIVFATSAGSLPAAGSSSVFMTSQLPSSSSSTQRFVIRSPRQQTQASPKRGVSLLTNSVLTQVPRVVGDTSLSPTKPMEVKVSRQLFHDTTASQGSLMSLLSNAVVTGSNTPPPKLSQVDTKIVSSTNQQMGELSGPVLQNGTDPVVSHLEQQSMSAVDLDSLAEQVLTLPSTSVGSLNGFGESTSVSTGIQENPATYVVSPLLVSGSEGCYQMKSLPPGLDSLPSLNGSSSLQLDSSSSCLQHKDAESTTIKADMLPKVTSPSPGLLSSSSTTSNMTSVSSTASSSSYSLGSNIVSKSSLSISIPLSPSKVIPSVAAPSSSCVLTSCEQSPLTSAGSTGGVPPQLNEQPTICSGSLGEVLNPADQTDYTAEAMLGHSNSEEILLADSSKSQEVLPPTTGEPQILQTEDGTFIVQSGDGQTYQLEGAQGLSLEAVHALLADTLHQLTGTGQGL